MKDCVFFGMFPRDPVPRQLSFLRHATTGNSTGDGGPVSLYPDGADHTSNT